MKILHFAVENYAGVPGNMVKAERELGHESYLITLYRSSQRFNDEDICLNLPFVAKKYMKYMKSFLFPEERRIANVRKDEKIGTPTWKPANVFIDRLFKLRDKYWERKIRNVLNSIKVDTFDVLFLDGGAGFLRSGRIVQELKNLGIKIVVCYYGSDLRTRGIIPSVDRMADYRFTVEYDHTILYPEAQFIFAPFELAEYAKPVCRQTEKIRIGHAPTNRLIKGTNGILKQLYQLQRRYPIEIVLIENLPHQQALSLKESCDIFIDNIGELGYGINGLEALAMGIPTAVEILPDFEEFLGDHPFINISKDTIVEKLIPFIQSEELRKEYGDRGNKWVRDHHDPIKVVKKVLNCIPK